MTKVKKGCLVLASICCAVCIMLGVGNIPTAYAGITETKPAGAGLITSSGTLNEQHFKFVEVNEGDKNAYASKKVTDHVVEYDNSEWAGMLVSKPVPKELMAKENAKVTLTYSIVGLKSDAAQLVLVPGAKSLSENATYGYVLTGSDNGIVRVPSYRTSEKPGDPVTELIALYDNNTNKGAIGNGMSWQAYSWSCGTFKNNISSYKNATFKMEMTVNEGGWVDVTLINGFFHEWQRWTNEGVKITNWAPYDGSSDFYANCWAHYADGMVIDNVDLSVSYTENSQTKTDVIFNTNMDDSSKVTVDSSNINANGCYVANGMTYRQNGISGLIVTNPNVGSGVMTRSELVVDNTLDKNVELETSFSFTNIAEGQKIGLGFGYKTNRNFDGERNFIYFTKDGDKIMFGAESVNANNDTIQFVPLTEVVGAVTGESATKIDVSILGTKNNFVVTVSGIDEPVTLENFNANGYFGITAYGTGELTYIINETLTMSGYVFNENGEEAKFVSSNFDGNYINSTKFQVGNEIATENHIVKGDKTSHDITGMTAENGKVGFYGTSTGTRILTTDKYADFVMQFDYTSIPTQKRGQLTGVTRYSGAYLMFGMEEGGLALTDPTVYAIGIIEGIADPLMYGTSETVITSLGKALSCGGTTLATSTLDLTTTPDDNSIPRYNAGGYDASKGNNNVMEWYNPSDTGLVYSFYNKTTRVKLVAINNNVALFVGEVNSDGEVAEYVKIMSFKAENTLGYVGIGTDAPAWFELDNLAITPISREVAVEKGIDFVPVANLVADVNANDMSKDLVPTNLDKPVLTVNNDTSKLTWTAVEGASSYEVVIKLNGETVKQDTVTVVEYDLSTLTKDGTYTITVKAIPEDSEAFVESRGTTTYTIGGQTGGDDSQNPSKPDEDKPSEEKSGCSGSVDFGTSIMLVLCLAILTVVISLKRKNNK